MTEPTFQSFFKHLKAEKATKTQNNLPQIKVSQQKSNPSKYRNKNHFIRHKFSVKSNLYPFCHLLLATQQTKNTIKLIKFIAYHIKIGIHNKRSTNMYFYDINIFPFYFC